MLLCTPLPFISGLPVHSNFNVFFFGRITVNNSSVNRGYYMAVWRYEISLWVVNDILRVGAVNEWNIFQHEKRNFVSPSNHVVHYYVNTNEIPNHFTSIAFCHERCNLLCSHSNGDLFTCKDHVMMGFHYLAWHIIFPRTDTTCGPQYDVRLWQSFLKEKQVPQRLMVLCVNANEVGVYLF